MSDAAAPQAKWRDASVATEDRIRDLIGLMTLDEKISQLTVDAPVIERIGMPAVKPGNPSNAIGNTWGGECLHGLCNTGRATQFPMPIGMAATFDPALIEKVADAVSDEARAKYHDVDWGVSTRATLTFYTPVINILRDPRWGRAQETYGEDPVLTSAMGAAFVRGLQGDHPKYLKVAACAKHLGVHSGPERLRQEFDARVTRKDMAETYLPAFEALVKEGVATVMATYNRVNGEHCCASKTLIGEFLRGRYGFKGMVVSDGGALGSLHTTHKMTADAVETAGLCLRNGCDLEIGDCAYPHISEAIERGLLTEDDVDRALARVLEVRFRIGDFDPAEGNPYTQIKRDVIQCSAHLKLAQETAAKSVVLLKNNGILPLSPDRRTVLVTGPTSADIQVLLGNFYRGVSGDLRTILEGVVSAAPEGTTVTHMQGCFLTHPNIYPSDWVLGLSEWADAVVAVVGFSPLMEGEQGECIGAPDGGDKSSIALPTNQLELLRGLKGRGKPLIVVVTGGCPIELEAVHEMADAVLMAWYPGERGGLAVGDVLFGNVSPSGKLPVTFPKSLSQLPEYTNYDVEGRTYRYMTEEPMYPFGFGLGYARFAYSDLALSQTSVAKGESLDASFDVKNTGECEADEVVQLYLTDLAASVPTPRFALKTFERVTLRSGESKRVSLRITPEMMRVYDMNGDPQLEAGAFKVSVGGSAPDARSIALGASEHVSAEFLLTGE